MSNSVNVLVTHINLTIPARGRKLRVEDSCLFAYLNIEAPVLSGEMAPLTEEGRSNLRSALFIHEETKRPYRKVEVHALRVPLVTYNARAQEKEAVASHIPKFLRQGRLKFNIAPVVDAREGDLFQDTQNLPDDYREQLCKQAEAHLRGRDIYYSTELDCFVAPVSSLAVYVNFHMTLNSDSAFIYLSEGFNQEDKSDSYCWFSIADFLSLGTYEIAKVAHCRMRESMGWTQEEIAHEFTNLKVYADNIFAKPLTRVADAYLTFDRNAHPQYKQNSLLWRVNAFQGEDLISLARKLTGDGVSDANAIRQIREMVSLLDEASELGLRRSVIEKFIPERA